MDTEGIRELYRKRARRYDLTANLYYLLGFREWAYRKEAVKALELRRGDTVVEIGCGTGLNLSLLESAVGPGGHIIGVDLTDAMLAKAHARVRRMGWSNVEMVQSAAQEYTFPRPLDGILSTFAITLIPEFDEVIGRGSRALSPGRRWVILDLKIPSNWLSRLARLFTLAVRPFGGSLELMSRHPWESLETYLENVRMDGCFFGFAYIASGQRGPAASGKVGEGNPARGCDQG